MRIVWLCAVLVAFGSSVVKAEESPRPPEERESYARVLIKAGRYEDANTVLRDLIKTTTPDDPLHLRAHVLLLEANDGQQSSSKLVDRALGLERAKQRVKLVDDLRRPQAYAWSGFAASALGVLMLALSVPLQHQVGSGTSGDGLPILISTVFGMGGGLLSGVTGLLADWHQPFSPVLTTLVTTALAFVAILFLFQAAPTSAPPVALAFLAGGVIFNGLRWEFTQRKHADEARLALDQFNAAP